MGSMKEESIKNYILSIDFTKEDWSINKIGKDMKMFLGEEPGIDVVYKKDVILNEFKGESTEVLKVEKIQIIFTDLDDKYKKLEFIIENNIY